MIHELKTIQPFFDDVSRGKKDFEVRRNDRDFKVGDDLRLREFDPDLLLYTGFSVYKTVKYILDDPKFVKEGYVILGME